MVSLPLNGNEYLSCSEKQAEFSIDVHVRRLSSGKVQPESHSVIPFEPTYKATSAIITDVVYMNGGLTITFAGRWDNVASPEKQNDFLLQTFHLSGDERLNQHNFVSIKHAAEKIKG